MTTEEKEKAIRWLTEEVRSLRLAPTVNGCKPDNWAESLEVMETCLEAVRDHFPDAKKMMPLTMKQLLDLGEKAESGEKIIVYCTPLNDWCKVFKYGIMFFGTEDYRSWREVEETYGKDWLAYAYPPAHIDMEAWVSVEEKLPDAEEEVRLCCMTAFGHRYQCQGFYVPPGTHLDDSGYSWDWERCEEYDEERDDYLVNPGWYESTHNWDEYSACGIVDRVIYWMPLPETPGELEKRLRGGTVFLTREAAEAALKGEQDG